MHVRWHRAARRGRRQSPGRILLNGCAATGIIQRRRRATLAAAMRLSPWTLGGGGVALAIVFAAAYTGDLGALVTCGADGARVCMAWPGLVSAATWLMFVGLIAALAAVQARYWRHTSVARREVLLLGAVLF